MAEDFAGTEVIALFYCFVALSLPFIFSSEQDRYGLALVLDIPEKDIPTDAVSYSIPNVWTPALREDCDPPVPVSIRIDLAGRVKMMQSPNAVIQVYVYNVPNND